MAGPWEDYQQPTQQSTGPTTGPWSDYGVQPSVAAPPAHARDLADAIVSGLQSSSTGLALRGKLPDQQLDENAPWYHRLGAAAGGVVGDLPAMGLGAAAGTVVAGPGIGTTAGAFAAPMGIREALMDAYTHNYAMSWSDVWEITKSALLGAGKGATIGVVTGGAGKLVEPFAATLGPVAGGATKFGTELSALTATSAAVEQHMPTAQDFLDNALLLAGAKGAIKAAGALRETYSATGRLPADVVADARRNPQVAADLAAGIVPTDYTALALDERIRAAVGSDPRPEEMRKALAPPGEPPLLGSIDMTRDPVKYEYITDQDTLKGVLRATEQQYQTEIQKQVRGIVTNRETASAALKMVAHGDIAEHVIGTAENAAEIYARGHILKGVTTNAFNALQAIKDIPEADLTPRMKLRALASIEQLSMTLADFRGARAEAGRALQIFNKLKADASVMGDVEQIIKLAERKGSLQDIAKLVSSFEDPTQMQRFAEDYSKASFTDKVLEAWKAGILSGPQTHLANLMGNAAKWLIEIPESALSATITAASRAARGEPLNMAQYKARALAPLYGLQMGGVDAVKVAAEVWQQKGEHLEKADIYKTAIPGKVGEVIRIPFKALQVEDALFRTVAERAEAHIMAVDRVTAEGVLHPDTAEYREAIVKYTERPDADLTGQDAADALKRVQEAGAEGVFSQRLGPRMETVQRAIAGHPIQFVIPFFRTPANLVSWAVQHTPGLNLLSGRWRADFAEGGEARSRALARVAIGTGLAMTAFSMAQNGTLTGGGLFTPEQRGTKSAAGIQPYSIMVGDKYYSYQRLEPAAKVLGLAADLVELMHATKEDTDKSKIAAMLVLMFGNATVSTTYLSGLANAMNAVLDPNRYAKNFLDQYATSLVPKIVGQTAAIMDPQKREVDGALDAIKSQLPWLREKLMPKRDVWGEPARNDKWFDVMPVAESQISQDLVKTEAVRLQIGIADAPKDAIEKGPFNPKDKKVEMSVEARDVFRYVSGHNAMEILGPIVNAPDWNRIPDFAKVEIYKRVIEGTRKQAQFAALPPDAEERMKVREKIVNEIIKQTKEAETKAPPTEKRIR